MKIQNSIKTMFCILQGVVFFIVMSVGFCCGVYANPPASVNLEYNSDKGFVSVEVKHISRSPKKHHIRKVELLNGESKIDEKFFAWQKSSGINFNFDYVAQEGDVLKVKAVCNQGGFKVEELVIPSPEDVEKKK